MVHRVVAGAGGPEHVDRVAGAHHADADAVGLCQGEHRLQDRVVDLARGNVGATGGGQVDARLREHRSGCAGQAGRGRAGSRGMRLSDLPGGAGRMSRTS